jgi:hypothetical protein
VQKNVRRASSLCESDRALQKSCSSSSAAVCFQDRHAPYLGAVSAHDNPCRSDRLSFCESEKMKCSLVVPFQFDLFRHALFFYEDTYANVESVLEFFFGRDSLDANSGFHSLTVVGPTRALQDREGGHCDSVMLTGRPPVSITGLNWSSRVNGGLRSLDFSSAAVMLHRRHDDESY